MKTSDCVRLSSALCLATVPATLACAQNLSDPTPIISAFNDTCRRGFPDLGTISRQAQSLGWIRLTARLLPEHSDPRFRKLPKPENFGKDGMMLTLFAPDALTTAKSSCGISISGEDTPDIDAFAEAVSATLDGARATIAKEGVSERATWRVKSSMVVRANVSKSGPIRTASLIVLATS